MPQVTEGLYELPDKTDEQFRWSIKHPRGRDVRGNYRETELRLTKVGWLKVPVITLYFGEKEGQYVEGMQLTREELLDLRDGIDFMLGVIDD